MTKNIFSKFAEWARPVQHKMCNTTVVLNRGFTPYKIWRRVAPADVQHIRFRSGFTLLETTIYLSLFSLIMGGVVVSAFHVFESTGRSQTRSMIQEEGDFLVAKVDWALSGIQSINAPAAPPVGTLCLQSDTLSVSKWDGTIGIVVVNLSGGDMVIARNGNPAKQLNNTNTEITNLLFKHCFTGGNNPESVETSFTVTARTPNGMSMSRNFFTSAYVRK